MGGGGGGDGGASQRAAEQEAQKASARAQLNDIFGESGSETGNANKAAREALYSDIRDNAFTAGKRGLDEAKDKATRNNNFALFAQGLNGGSEDIDQNALLGRTYDQGLLDLGAKADSAKTEFKTGDEQTRLNLLQSIDAGMDQSSAISSAINQQKNNLDQASATAQGTNLGDLFATSGALYTKSQAAQGKNDALNFWSNYNQLGGRSGGASPNGYGSKTY